MEPVATFSGLASGIDTASIVEGLVQLERRPITLLQQQQQDLNGITGRLGSIQTLMTRLQDAATALDDRDSVMLSTASSSNEDAVTATASGNASLGSFSVEVTSLATAERTYSEAFSARDTAGLFGTGTLSVQVGSATAVDITIDANDTLDGIVSKLNASGADLTAGVLYDGTNYRLQVSGNSLGAENAITFTETGTSLGLDDPANEVVAAADAIFSIDGFAMTRPTNSVSDAIVGTNLELKAPTTGATTISVRRDGDAIKENVQAFVDAYNAVQSSINAEFAFSGAARLGDSLSGDSTLRGIQTRLRSQIGAEVTGLSGSYSRLSDIGISFNRDGTIELDDAEFETALGADPQGVASLFVEDQVAGTSGLMVQFDDLIKEYTDSDGILSTKIDLLEDRSRGIDDQIDSMERRVEQFEERLRAQFTSMEQAISRLNSQGDQLNAILGQG
ncbi:MAG: flagellar filament capping protein FliD [Myxococcota bacterium]